MQRLGGRLAVGDERKANIARPRIESVRLQSGEITAGNNANAGVPIESYGRRFVAAVLRNIEPDAEAAGWAFVTVAIAENLIGEIELGAIKLAVLLDMRLVAVGCDRDMLQRHRHLRGGDIAQLV